MPEIALFSLAATTALILAATPATQAQSTPGSPATEAAATSKSNEGRLRQLPAKTGCVADRSRKSKRCTKVRALKTPGPIKGSRAIAVSPDGKHVYVASQASNAITVLNRNRNSGALKQSKQRRGCISLDGSSKCRSAVGLAGPNSLTITPDGRHLYASSQTAKSVTAFTRDKKTGRLTQLTPDGCWTTVPLDGCGAARGLVDPDVIITDPDGRHIYVGSFIGGSVATFDRDPKTGSLQQPSGSAACVAEGLPGCAPGRALQGTEGLTTSRDGNTIYTASAISNAIAILQRNETGGLSQADDSSGCMTNGPTTNCLTGRSLVKADALVTAPNGRDLYATTLGSKSISSFRMGPNSTLQQKPGIEGCLVNQGAANCRFGLKMSSPEGAVVSADGRNVYVVSYKPGTIAVLDRDPRDGSLKQKAGNERCLAGDEVKGCIQARALAGATTIANSPNGKHIYVTASESDAISVFKRIGAKRKQ